MIIVPKQINGYSVFAVRAFDPKLERERSRDGSCLNVSAQERNAKRLEAASTITLDHRNRRMYCASHVYDKLRESFT